MAASEELILLSRDDEKIACLLAVIPLSTRSSFVPMATFRLALVHSAVHEAMKNAVSCHVPVDEISAAEDVSRFLVARIDDPELRQEVARAAEKAVAHVRARCAAAVEAHDVEFRILVLLDSDESEPVDRQEHEEAEADEAGSDLESDEDCWQRGASDGELWHNVHDDDEHQAVVLASGGDQFAACRYDQGPTTPIPDEYEVRSDGPEFFDQHELTSRDLRRILRIAFKGGDLEGDEAYRRAFHGNARVSRVSMAAICHKAVASTKLPPPSPTPHMRTGF